MSSLEVSMEEWSEKLGLRVRTLTVCKRNDLHTLRDVLEHYRRWEGFRSLAECGPNTDRELKMICMYYALGALDSELAESEKLLILARYPKLPEPLSESNSRLEKAVVVAFRDLSHNTQIYLLKHLKYQLTFKAVYEQFIEGRYSCEYRIPYLRKAQLSELQHFLKELVLAKDQEYK